MGGQSMSENIQIQTDDNNKIVLPKELQIEMMKFFLRTSIPRKKRLEMEKQRLLDENDKDNG